jgi:hypothetical protein
VKSLSRAVLFASCAAIVVTGCGTSHALPPQVSASPPQVSASPQQVSASPPQVSASPPQVSAAKAGVSPRQRAEADAAAIRASFVPPPGARRLTAAPDASEGILDQPAMTAVTPNLVDDPSFWLAPGQPQAVLAWEKAHMPRRFSNSFYGSGSQPGGGTEWNDGFELPPVPGVLNSRQLIVEVASAGHGRTAIRTDAQVEWLPPKPAAERVPATAESVTISAVRSGSAGRKQPPGATITNRDEFRRIASLVDGLQVWPPDQHACSLPPTWLMKLTFRGADGQTLAVVTGDPGGCDIVDFTAGGKSLLSLSGADFLKQQVLAIAGLHWGPRQVIGSV